MPITEKIITKYTNTKQAKLNKQRMFSLVIATILKLIPI